MIGFCNGLAIVIGGAQLHPFTNPDTHEWKSGAELYWMILICFASMIIMEVPNMIPLRIFKVVPSSLLAIIVAICIEFLIIRPMGDRTDVIGDVFEFTFDTAFPIPFFVETDAVSYDLSNILSSEG